MIDGIENEKDLLRKAIGGESSAFGLLYDKYQPRIYRFVFFRVSQREEAEDITHQVFLNAWKRIEYFDDHGLPFASWLFRIARNKVIDHYRTKKTTEPIDDEFSFAFISDNEDNIDKKMALKNVYSALSKLSEDQREIIILRFVEGLKNKEISQITNKNQGTIRVLQYRAIKNLKNILREK